MLKPASEALPLHVIQEWEVPDYPHCSNCLHAKVHGHPERPTSYCAKGEGKDIDLWRLIRRHSPRGFRAADKCPHFESMGGPW